MYGTVIILPRPRLQPRLLHDFVQLAMQILPFPNPVKRQKVLAARFTQAALRQIIAQLVNEVPQGQIAEEIGVFMGKSRMQFVRCLLLVDRPFARVLQFQGRGDNQDFMQTGFVVPCQDNASDAGINGDATELCADLGEFVFLGQRPDFKQRLVTVFDCIRTGRVKEWEILNFAQLQRLDLQNDRRQIGALDFRRCEAVPVEKIFFAEEPHADTGAHTAATPLPLVCRRLRNGLNR